LVARSHIIGSKQECYEIGHLSHSHGFIAIDELAQAMGVKVVFQNWNA
jgi:hypothetical protein